MKRTAQGYVWWLGMALGLLASSAQAQSPLYPTPLPEPELQKPQPVVSPPDTLQAPAFKTTASFLTRYELRRGYEELGRSRGRFLEGDAGVYRARLGFRTEPLKTGGPDVVLQFTPQASGWLGETSTIVDYQLGLHEGYLRLAQPGGNCWIDAGRFEMSYGDALVVGNLGWHQTARAFEGVRAHVALGRAWVDTFVTQVAEGRPLSEPFGAGDTYFYGVYAGLGAAIAQQLDLDVYLLAQTSPGVAGQVDESGLVGGRPGAIAESIESASEFTLGARAKQHWGKYYYRVEAGVQRGHRPDWPAEASYYSVPTQRLRVKSLAYQADAAVGATLQPGLTVSLGGLIASGDDPSTARDEAWNQLYPTAHKFLGLADVFGARSNVASANAAVSFQAAKKLVLKLQGHAFWGRQVPIGFRKFTGGELDTHAIVALGKGLTLRGMYGLFVTHKKGRFARGPGAGRVAQFLEMQLAFSLR